MYFGKSCCNDRPRRDEIIICNVWCICVISVPIFIFRYNKPKCKIFCHCDTSPHPFIYVHGGREASIVVSKLKQKRSKTMFSSRLAINDINE